MRTKFIIHNSQFKLRRGWVLVLSILAFVIGAQLLVSNILSVRGSELAELEKQASELARNNQLIKQEMAQHSSLNKIALSAESLGMVKPEQILYIDVGQAVASLPTVQ
mgnify:FL=1